MTREKITYHRVSCNAVGCDAVVTDSDRHNLQDTDWQKFGIRDFCPKHHWPSCETCGRPMRPRSVRKDQAKFTSRWAGQHLECMSCSIRTTPSRLPEEVELDPDSARRVRCLLSKEPDRDALLAILGLQKEEA